MSSVRPKALEWAIKGFSIFPCNSDKSPAIHGGFHSASSDAEQVQKWWTQHPDAMIGLWTKGMLVVDIDQKGDINGYQSWSELVKGLNPPETFTVLTPSGGQHFYYSLPEGTNVRNSASILGPGIDIRGKSGYVIAPGSKLPDGREYTVVKDLPIAEAPEWLIHLANSRSKVRVNKDSSLDSKQNPLTDNVVPLVAAGADIPEGTRNTKLTSIAGRLRRVGADAEQIEEQLVAINAELSEPLDETEIQTIAGSVARYEPSVNLAVKPVYSTYKRELSDLGNVERLVDHFDNTIKYVPEFARWMRWDDYSWTFTDSLLEDIKKVVRSINTEAAVELDDDRRKALRNHAIRSEGKQRIDALEDLAKRDNHFRVPASMLDRKPYLIGVPNGVIDLTTRKLITGEYSQYITKRCSVDFNPKASAPRWVSFLFEVMDNDLEIVLFLQRLCGSALISGNREQILPIFHGNGANGKSTMVEVIKSVMGDYCKTTGASTFCNHKDDGSGRPDIVRLVGSRLVLSTESGEGDELDEQVVKSLTGGDTISVRGLYSNLYIEFTPEFLPILTTNHKPIIKGDDYAIWRRLCLVPFVMSFKPGTGNKPDTSLKQQLLAESDGVLAWMVKGAQRYQRSGLRTPSKIKAATSEYRSDMDIFGSWIEDECEIGAGFEVITDDLYSNYKNYCEKQGHKAMSNTRVGRKLNDRGFLKSAARRLIHGKRKTIRMGIRVYKPEYLHEIDQGGWGDAAA